MEDINWSELQPESVSSDLLAAVKTAALVEANSEDYVTYLHNVFPDDVEFRAAADHWGVEEAQHGAALGRWAELIDPDFDFAASLAYFREVYRLPLDSEYSVRGSRAGELLARCVVESGTCSFYSAIRDFTREPVLRQICTRIAQDESQHYRLFKRHAARYPRLSVWSRLKVALGRVFEASDDEFGYAWYSANHLNERDHRPYDRATCAGIYQGIATGMYRPNHVRTLVHMIGLALGLSPRNRMIPLVGSAFWWLLRRQNRRYRSAAASTGPA